MKYILLILNLISCLRNTTHSTVRKFLDINGQKLEIDEKSYVKTEIIEYGKREVYKVYKEDQGDLTDKIIENIINTIILEEDKNERIINKFCEELDKEGEVSINAVLMEIYDKLKPAVLEKWKVNKISNAFLEAINSFPQLPKPEAFNIKKFVFNIFKKGDNCLNTYQVIEKFLPYRLDSKFKEELFEAIKLREYNEVRKVLEGIKDYYRKIVNASLDMLEEKNLLL